MKQTFLQALNEHNIDITDEQIQQFEQYYEELIEWNNKMNLTAITDKDLVYSKHFLDSASIAFFCNLKSIETLCDVGSGAGFPSIVLKILFPHLKITIVEALNKRLIFLQHIIDTLKLTNVTLVHERAEIYGQTHREQFDIVTARAVAKFKMLAELCVPLVKKDGVFIAMKGSLGDEELEGAKKLLDELGVKEIQKELFTLQNNDAPEQRTLYFCYKIKNTPVKFPRAFAQIKKDNM